MWQFKLPAPEFSKTLFRIRPPPVNTTKSGCYVGVGYVQGVGYTFRFSKLNRPEPPAQGQLPDAVPF
jgi:hypothetical protein